MLPAKDFQSWVLRAAGFRAASTKDEILGISRSHCSSHQAQDPQHVAGATSQLSKNSLRAVSTT